MSFDRRTFRQLTAPGYFDFSAQQTPKTAAMTAWFDLVTSYCQEQVRLFDKFFRLWATTDYSGVTNPIYLYVYSLAQKIGFAWTSNNNLNRDVVSYLLAPRPKSFADCINQLYNLLFNIGWLTSIGQVIVGKGNPIRYAEVLAIYSDSPYVPSTPGNTVYARRAWQPPDGWTLAPASSTYVSRGYLYNNEIVWLPPVPLVTATMYNVELLADLPGSAVDGDLCGVFDDGSGDQGAVYVYSGGNWYKSTTTNDLQGSVFINTYLDSSGVFAPDTTPPVTSQTPPPPSGPSGGYGFYGTYGVNQLSTNLELVLSLTADGLANLGTIINLFRRIKPAVALSVILYATYGMDVYVIKIKDLHALN